MKPRIPLSCLEAAAGFFLASGGTFLYSCKAALEVTLSEGKQRNTYKIITIIILVASSSAQVRHAVTLMALLHDYSWSLGLKSFLKPSQLPGEYTACATIVCATRLNQSQEPSLPSKVPIYPWVERSNYS